MGAASVILSVSNDLVTDQRVHRVAVSLQESGYQVLVVGRKKKNSLSLNKRTYKTHRLNLIFQKGKLFYAELNIKLFFFLLVNKAEVYTANDLDTLLPNFLVSHLKRKKLVYDSHEYFTEVPELLHKPLTKKFWLSLEKFIFPRLSRISTVNQTIAGIYKQKYNKEIEVIRNVPFKRKISAHHTPQQNIIIYQGNINLGRGVDLMLESLLYLDNVSLYLAGNGDLYHEMVLLSQKLGVTDKVRFFGQVPMEQLPEITGKAKIGLSLEDPMGLNYQYCLPNKLLDYVQANIPVIVSDLPEVKQLVNAYKLGLILQKRDPRVLAEKIKLLLENTELYQEYKNNAIKASEELCWENEKHKLKKLYA